MGAAIPQAADDGVTEGHLWLRGRASEAGRTRHCHLLHPVVRSSLPHPRFIVRGYHTASVG